MPIMYTDTIYVQCCSLKDQSIVVVLITTSNKTEVGEEGGWPPFILPSGYNPDVRIILCGFEVYLIGLLDDQERDLLAVCVLLVRV